MTVATVPVAVAVAVAAAAVLAVAATAADIVSFTVRFNELFLFGSSTVESADFAVIAVMLLLAVADC